MIIEEKINQHKEVLFDALLYFIVGKLYQKPTYSSSVKLRVYAK